ncbi:hypothetical protein [Psychrobacter sp. PAMC 21119]|uniref:hypothetical protein n=1 Tax=Psychrobacter sp. PAMC 21119 TaxID=1112209 RepID=UPI000289FBBB|nr:hypothetical protein [Psychrobacter sp. PAMC 21119]
MALYDINEFLTLNDVAEYLTDKCNYDFNLEYSIDQDRLIETIIQLVRNHKLHPVFHYSGSVDFLEKKVITSKSGRFINHEIVSLDITHDMTVRDYYFVSDKNFDKLIENNCSNYINVINCTIEPYHVEGKQKIFENNILYYREIKEDFSIIFHDLLYPKSDLAKLFNQTEADTEVIEKLREKIAGLENQLAQAKTEIEDKSANDEPTHHKSVGSMQALVTTLIKMAEYDKADLADPYGEFNKLIQAKAEGLGLSVKKDFIAKWLKKADEVL